MKLWLDDLRDPAEWMPDPQEWTWVKTAAEAIALLNTHRVREISFDHDLGEEAAGTGADVARYIEERAFKKTIPRMRWRVHSANPVGRKNITAIMQSAERFWRYS